MDRTGDTVCRCQGVGRRVKNSGEGLFALASGAVFLELLERDPKMEASLCLMTHMCLRMV